MKRLQDKVAIVTGAGNGIGQAMIATVLGLGIAIPLLFINSGLASISGSITQILDEQSQALLAADMLSRRQ